MVWLWNPRRRKYGSWWLRRACDGWNPRRRRYGGRWLTRSFDASGDGGRWPEKSIWV